MAIFIVLVDQLKCLVPVIVQSAVLFFLRNVPRNMADDGAPFVLLLLFVVGSACFPVITNVYILGS